VTIKERMRPAVKTLTAAKNWLLRPFFKVEHGLRKVNYRRVAITLSAITFVVIVVVMSLNVFYEDTSFLQRSDKALGPKGQTTASSVQEGTKMDSLAAKLLIEISDPTTGAGTRKVVQSGRSSPVNYKAQQVILRSDGSGEPGLPVGSNFIGKTLIPIDSREPNQLVKVILPYGAKGKVVIQKNTVLIGTASYPGRGEKFFIRFTKGVSPEGKEFEIEAQALSTEDYSNGVVGDYHGTADARIATTMGLTMLSGATDVLTEKEAVGGPFAGAVVAKPTLKNAFYHGVSQVAQSEATRQLDKIGEAQDYVMLPAGSDLIVSLTKEFQK